MSEIIRVQDQYYILASSPRGAESSRVLKHGETFAVFDRFGDVLPIGSGEHGLYHLGTRHLSRFEVRLAGKRPLLLSSSVREDNDLLAIDLTNPDIAVEGVLVLPRSILHLFRAIFLLDGVCYERLRVTNYGSTPASVEISLVADADFADIFEVRGTRRVARGLLRPPDAGRESLTLGYLGLDGIDRWTRLHFSPAPEAIEGTEARFRLHLAPQESVEQLVAIACESAEVPARVCTWDTALDCLSAGLEAARGRQASIESGNEQFSAWVARSTADLLMITSETPAGPYPYAGIPWFSTIFGRDGIIAAWQMLWIDPHIARGVLGHLASTQARDFDSVRDAEPGKILHEARNGEMAALGEIPFGRYYGSVDATPLFVALAGEYWQRTGDREFIERLWPHIDLALHWLDSHGDPDGDGFVEYDRRSADGLVHQGWKDSHDSVFHADGESADGPIALCEVQAYVYRARLAAADMAAALGEGARAGNLRVQAEDLRERFNAAFWDDALGTYVLALDGRKEPCRVGTSNAGHCLFGGIAPPARAAAVAARLFSDEMFSGWGIRTLAADQPRFNPMSYHNGSVWPHDNAMIALGLSQYGFTSHVTRVAQALFDVGQAVDLNRLPELFCGFRRRPGEGPTLYPVACAPQAWAAGTVFMLLRAMLGLTIDARRREIRFLSGQLPPFLPRLRISRLRVGDALVDLDLQRHELDLGVTVVRRSGDVEIVVVK